MKLEGNNEYIINRIIFWIDQIKQLKSIKRFIASTDTKKTLRLRRKVSIITSWAQEMELTPEATCYLSNYIENYIEHLESLINDQDEGMVQIAKSIIDGNITEKGR